MSIEMRMEKTLKSNSKKEVTALDVIVNDAATGALPYMSRSGGERVRRPSRSSLRWRSSRAAPQECSSDSCLLTNRRS